MISILLALMLLAVRPYSSTHTISPSPNLCPCWACILLSLWKKILVEMLFSSWIGLMKKYLFMGSTLSTMPLKGVVGMWPLSGWLWAMRRLFWVCCCSQFPLLVFPLRVCRSQWLIRGLLYSCSSGRWCLFISWGSITFSSVIFTLWIASVTTSKSVLFLALDTFARSSSIVF